METSTDMQQMVFTVSPWTKLDNILAGALWGTDEKKPHCWGFHHVLAEAVSAVLGSTTVHSNPRRPLFYREKFKTKSSVVQRKVVKSALLMWVGMWVGRHGTSD